MAGRTGLTATFDGHHQLVVVKRFGQHHGAGDTPEGAVEAELADKRHSAHRSGVEHTRGHQDADGDREIQTRPAFPDARGCQYFCW